MVADRFALPRHPLRSAGRRPSWPGHPILGAVPEIRRDWLGTLSQMGRTSDAAHFRLLHRHAHLLGHPDQVHHVLVGNAGNYGKRTLGYRRMRTVLGNGLVTSEGSFWLRQRRIAQPAFHRRRIETFAETMSQVAEETIDRWEQGAVLDVSREMMRLTLRVVSLTMLSRDVAEESDEVGDALGVVLEHVMHRTTTPWSAPEWVPSPRNRRFHRAATTLDRVVRDIITERRRSGTSGEDLLGMLMDARDEETGEAMNDEQLRDEVMTIFLAGHETTAMALTWTFHLLARHPHEEARVRRELDEVLDGHAPSLSTLPALERTDRVLHESMRLYPPVWIVGRSVAEDDDVAGHPVRGGDWVFLSPWVTHRRPDLWPEPERFDPDRFLPDRAAERPRYAFFPFAGGRRKCIGDQFALMEARLVLATVLQRVKLEPLPGRTVVPQPLVTLRPRDGLPMRIARTTSRERPRPFARDLGDARAG